MVMRLWLGWDGEATAIFSQWISSSSRGCGRGCGCGRGWEGGNYRDLFAVGYPLKQNR